MANSTRKTDTIPIQVQLAVITLPEILKIPTMRVSIRRKPLV
jgi:hypothetical protein